VLVAAMEYRTRRPYFKAPVGSSPAGSATISRTWAIGLNLVEGSKGRASNSILCELLQEAKDHDGAM
jgi:hypothetical protein